jgi:hypothetical protein
MKEIAKQKRDPTEKGKKKREKYMKKRPGEPFWPGRVSAHGPTILSRTGTAYFFLPR